MTNEEQEKPATVDSVEPVYGGAERWTVFTGGLAWAQFAADLRAKDPWAKAIVESILRRDTRERRLLRRRARRLKLRARAARRPMRRPR